MVPNPTPDPRSANPVKHGLFARNPVMKGESLEEYQEHLEALVADLNPANRQEALIAQRIADATWRLHRIPELETQIDAMAPEEAAKYLGLLSLYEGRLERKVQQLYKLLRELRQEAEKTNFDSKAGEKCEVKGQPRQVRLTASPADRLAPLERPTNTPSAESRRQRAGRELENIRAIGANRA